MKYLGIDLGGTNIAAGVVDENFNIISLVTCKTNIPRPEEDICSDMARLATQSLSAAGLTLSDVPSIGIGCPGSVNIETGVVEYSANLLFHNWKITEIMQNMLQKKVFLENDANAAAYAEHVTGAAKGANSSVTITIGTGIGGGIIIDNQIYRGCNFAGAEVGHTVIVHNGLPCPCGRNGCWEVYSSAKGLVRKTLEALQQDTHKTSALWNFVKNGNLQKISGRAPFAAARTGDRLAQAVLAEYISELSCGITNLINIFQPEVLCIGGGLSKEGDDLLLPVEYYVNKERYSKHASLQTKICKAKLHNDAGIIGAAIQGQRIYLGS